MVVAQVPDRLPQVGLRRRAEDFRGGPLRFGSLSAEEHSATPNAVLSAPHGETNVNRLSVETNRRKVVNDLVER